MCASTVSQMSIRSWWRPYLGGLGWWDFERYLCHSESELDRWGALEIDHPVQPHLVGVTRNHNAKLQITHDYTVLVLSIESTCHSLLPGCLFTGPFGRGIAAKMCTGPWFLSFSPHYVKFCQSSHFLSRVQQTSHRVEGSNRRCR